MLTLATRQYVTLSTIARQKKSRESCQLDAENQVYCQPYRNISRLVLLRVLSTIEVGLKFTIVDVPSAFVLTHISSDRADVTWIRAS